MKRYLLFAGALPPMRGWDDFEEDFDDLEKAERAGIFSAQDWFQVVDLETGMVVREA